MGLEGNYSGNTLLLETFKRKSDWDIAHIGIKKALPLPYYLLKAPPYTRPK